MCDCYRKKPNRAGGRYFDRAGGDLGDALEVAHGLSHLGRAGGAESACWLPQEAQEFFRQPWARAWVGAIEAAERIPAVGPLLAATIGGGVVSDFVTFVQSGCDVSAFSQAKSAALAKKYRAAALFWDSDVVEQAVNIGLPAAAIFFGIPIPPGIGTLMRRLTPTMRCLAQGFELVAANKPNPCIFGQCVLQGVGVLFSGNTWNVPAAQVDVVRSALRSCSPGIGYLPKIKPEQIQAATTAGAFGRGAVLEGIAPAAPTAPAAPAAAIGIAALIYALATTR